MPPPYQKSSGWNKWGRETPCAHQNHRHSGISPVSIVSPQTRRKGTSDPDMWPLTSHGISLTLQSILIALWSFEGCISPHGKAGCTWQSIAKKGVQPLHTSKTKENPEAHRKGFLECSALPGGPWTLGGAAIFSLQHMKGSRLLSRLHIHKYTEHINPQTYMILHKLDLILR